MYLLTLTFALGYLSGQLPIPHQALAATVLICLLLTSRIVSPSTPPADEHYGKAVDTAANPLDPKAIYGSQKEIENKQDQQVEQRLARGRAPRQTIGRTVSSESLTVQPYERQSQGFQLPRRNRETTSPREPELSPLLPRATSSPATVALTAPHCETRNTEMGNIRPNPPQAFGCDQEPSTHEATEKPGVDQVSPKPHRSKSIEYAGMEQHQGPAADDGQGSSPDYPRIQEKVRPQAVEARLTGVTNEGFLAEAHVDVSQAAPSGDTGTQQRSSLTSSSSSEEMEVSQQSTNITTPGVDEKQDRHAPATKDDQVTETSSGMKSTSDKNGGNSNIGEVNMSDLLKTSNRLLEEGRQLLVDGMRQPRQAQSCVVGDESESNRKGWYPHDV
ncbi:hypothetical protein SLS53_008304 [Cytospora paraplurivora]|uniref:Uncharacterized protein n=1 Tax=Cytospora paraplurivora TaxID=2898453 RepID=A0AAN9U7E6_9PEZI